MRSRGFTTIELLITLMIVGIISAAAVPSFTRMLENSRRVASVNEFIAALNFARSEAVKRAGIVVLCKSKNGVCLIDDSGYDSGYMVFADVNRDRKYTDGTDKLLHVHEAISRYTLIGDPNVRNYVAYTSVGTVDAAGEIEFIPDKCVQYQSKIAIKLVGRVNAIRSSCD